MWVIYDHPTDYPEKFVVRKWEIVQGNPRPVPTDEFYLGDTLIEARTHIPSGSYIIERYPDDDPKIVETWI